MSRLSSLDILLDPTPPEDDGRSLVLLPLSSGEAYISRQGLNNRFSYYFNKNRETLPEDDRLMAVYNFLADKIDRYRTEARNIVRALEIRDESADMTYQAMAMSSIMLAQDARRKGWPRKSQLDDIRKLKFHEAMALAPEEFADARTHTAGIAIGNDRYWVSQLQKNRGHYVVPMFHQAITESRPLEIAV